MKFYSAYTEDCLKEAKKLNLSTELQNITLKIEASQTSKFLENYRSPAKVKRAGKYRFIAYEKIFEENIIFIVLLRVLIKGKSEYEKFCTDSDTYCKKLLPEEVWFRNQIRKKDKEKIKEKEKLSKIESDYLFNPVPDDYEGSLMIYQSKRFNENIRNSDYKTQIAEIIRDIFKNNESLKKTEKNHSVYDNLIVYYKFFPNLNLLFLYQTVNNNTNEKIDKKEFEKICSASNTIEDILRVSFRSYPEYVLYDNDIWLDIQNESEGNLALSTEETKIFNSIIHNKFEEPLFPLFINGRAGSGKSTLLYYTFAHILLNHILMPKKLNAPLFLTYSPKLLETANSSIKKILKTNVKIRTKLTSDKVNLVDDYLTSSDYNKSFKTFRGFQKELLLPIKKKHFEDRNYYSFSKFKEDWNKYCKSNPSKYIRGITSEFAWYVIRTFIKGMLNHSDEFLEPDDYKNLPRELKTVEQATYEKIYESVFNNWYKNYLLENHFWDDQDLTKTVLENIDNLVLEHPAVFCDEAQDFSSIELELISELSLFSKRKIKPIDTKRIPFAFAGDPLQTINPTGFKWDTIQANFYEKIQNDYGRYDRKNPLNFKELCNNYRSSKPIVIFNNIIQLIRTVLFNLKKISPQESWFTTEYSIYPTLKINDLSIINEALKEEGKTRTIIIPCEEDQEKDYIQNRDSFLKEKAIINDEVVQNIWGPMNVKGLEYNTIIVYNFGDYLANSLEINLKDLVRLLLSDNTFQIDLSESKRIELEYFLNKLYVATSRAKKNLVIVDTDLGNKFLWSIFYDLIKELPVYAIENIDPTTNWDKGNQISEFQFSSEVINLAADKPEDLAKQYYQDGINSSNPRKLKTAAEYYKASNKLKDAYTALAKAYELENNYLKAAEFYEKIQEGDKAIQCLWKSNDVNKYKKIISVYENLPKNPNNIFFLASKFMLSDNRKNNSILFLRNFAHLIRDGENFDFYMLTHKSWDIIYSSMLDALEQYSKEKAILSDWDEAINILKNLSEKGIQIRNKPQYISLLFNLKQYKDVIEELTAANDFENELFYKSNAYSTTYPKNLEYYFKLKDFKIITQLFVANEKESEALNKIQKEFILLSLIEMKDAKKIESFVSLHSNDVDGFIDEELYEKICLLSYNSSHYSLGMTLIRVFERRDDKLFSNMLKNNIKASDGKLLTFLLTLFLYQEIIYNRIHTVVDILENRRAEFSFLPYNYINKPTLERVLLYALANKDDISKVSLEPRKRIQEYVKEMLVDDSRWIGVSNVKMAGAAIERLHMHIYARDYYETIYRNDFTTNEDKEFAKRRWLKVKQKQANQLPVEAQKPILEDIEKLYKNWGFDNHFNLDELEEYPNLEDKFELTLNESYKINKKITVQKFNPDIKIIFSFKNIEQISIKSNYNKNFIKIDNIEKSETIYFDLIKNVIESKEVNIFEKKLEENIKEYKISEWNMMIIFDCSSEVKLFKVFIGEFHTPIVTINI